MVIVDHPGSKVSEALLQELLLAAINSASSHEALQGETSLSRTLTVKSVLNTVRL